jgi:hypothetical protein
MGDRGRYDSAMFWLPFGTAAAVIGLALMTIGVTRLPANANVFGSAWFDGGLGVLAVGGLLLLWSLVLFLSRRREAAQATSMADPAQVKDLDWKSEAVRGYYRERENLFRTWQKDRKEKRARR